MSAEHSAADLTKIVTRVGEYLEQICPWSPTDHDTDEELVALHAALVGFSAPRDQIPDRGLAGILKDLCVDVDGALHQRLKADRSTVGDYEIERKGPSYANTWDHRRAAEEVSTAALVDENGELRKDSPIEAANTVANAILASAGISYWRVTAGDKFGVDLRKFRERGACTSPAGVILRKAAEPGESDPLLTSTDTKGNKPVSTRPDPGIPEKAGTPSPGST